MNEYKEPGFPSEDWNKELIQDIFLSMYQMHLDGISQEERAVFFRACLRSHEYSELLATYFKTPKLPSSGYEDFMHKLRENASTDVTISVDDALKDPALPRKLAEQYGSVKVISADGGTATIYSLDAHSALEEPPRPDAAPSPKVEATEQGDLFATIRAAERIPHMLGGRSQNLRDNKLLNKEIAAAKLKKSKEPPPPPPETKWETETDSPPKILLTIMIFAILLISSLFGYVSFMQDKQIEQCVNQDPNVKDCPTQCKQYAKDRADMPCACYDTTAYKDAPVRCVK